MKIDSYIKLIKQADKSTLIVDKPNTDTSSVSNKNYSSIEEFKNSGLPFRTEDTIIMPQGQRLINKVGILPNNDVKLNTLFDIANEINQVAPLYRRQAGATDTIELPKDSSIDGSHTYKDDTITYSWNSEAPMVGSASHETVHPYTPPMGFGDTVEEDFFQGPNPLNIQGYKGNHKRYENSISGSSYRPINSYRYNSELPATSDEWGRVLLPDFIQSLTATNREPAPPFNSFSDDLSVSQPEVNLFPYDIDNLRKRLSYSMLMQEVPYMGRTPQISPMGINRTITPEEFTSYTIPGEYDSDKNVFIEYPEKTFMDTDLERIFHQLNHRGITGYPGWLQNPKIQNELYPLLGQYQIPTDVEFFNRIKSSPELQEAKKQELAEKGRPIINDIKRYNTEIDKINASIKEYGDNPSLIAFRNKWLEYLQDSYRNLNKVYKDILPKYNYLDDSSDIVTNLFKNNPELYKRILKQKSLENPVEQLAHLLLLEKDPEAVYERYFMNLSQDSEKAKALKTSVLKRLRELLSRNDIETKYREELEIPLWLLNHAKRGINIVDGKLIPHAHLQGASQRIDDKTRREWTRLHGQVMQRLNQYKSNPRYLNVMKKWELSPFGEDMLGFNKPMLTIEQMRQILEDLNQEDRNYEIENSPQFQGYGYDTMA